MLPMLVTISSSTQSEHSSHEQKVGNPQRLQKNGKISSHDR